MAKTNVNVTWFVLSDILLARGDEPEFILPKFARPLSFFFFLIRFLALTVNMYRVSIEL